MLGGVGSSKTLGWWGPMLWQVLSIEKSGVQDYLVIKVVGLFILPRWEIAHMASWQKWVICLGKKKKHLLSLGVHALRWPPHPILYRVSPSRAWICSSLLGPFNFIFIPNLLTAVCHWHTWKASIFPSVTQ